MPVALSEFWNKYNDRSSDSRFVEVTRSWVSGSVDNSTSFDYFPDSFSAGQYIIFEQNMRFWGIRLNVGTPMVADSVSFVWEYYKSGTWVQLNVINGDALTKSGQQDVLFFVPLNSTVGQVAKGVQVRVRIASVTNPVEGGAQSGDYVRFLERAYVGTGTVTIDEYVAREKIDTYLIFSGAPSASLAVLTLPVIDLNSVTRLKFTISDSVDVGSGDSVIFVGTDGFGNAITEIVDVSAGNGTYYTQASFQSLTSVSCSGFTTGTIQIWCARGCIVNKAGVFNYTFIGTFWVGDGVTTTSLTMYNTNIELMADVFFFIDANATLTMGQKTTYNGVTVGSRGGSIYLYGTYQNNLSSVYCTRNSTSRFNFYGGQIGHFRNYYSTGMVFYNNPTMDWMDVLICGSTTGLSIAFYGQNTTFTRVSAGNNISVKPLGGNPGMIDCIVGGGYQHYHLRNTVIQGGKFASIQLQANGDQQRITLRDIDVTSTALTWGYTDAYVCSEGFRVQQTFTVTVIDSTGAIIQGAGVTIQDVFGSIVATGTTGVDGKFSVVLTQKTQSELNGVVQPWVVHTPHSVTISKTGYKTRTIQYIIDRKRDETEMLDVDAPAAPSGLTVMTISRTQLDLSWVDNSGGSAQFRIERSPNGESLWTHIATTEAGVTEYSDIDLACGTRYYYRVCGVNENGNSAYTDIVAATTDDCVVPQVIIELESVIP